MDASKESVRLIFILDLLRKLIPTEYNELLVKNEVRADGRGLDQQRPIEVKRQIF